MSKTDWSQMTYKDYIGLVVFGPIVIGAEILYTLVCLPSKIKFKYKISKEFKKEPLYISLEKMRDYDLGYYNKHYTKVPYYGVYRKYKEYIFDEYMNKAMLMANKYTGELAYVFNNEVICKDIEKYKLNTSTKNRLNKLIAC